jgi:hypothetical protein
MHRQIEEMKSADTNLGYDGYANETESEEEQIEEEVVGEWNGIELSHKYYGDSDSTTVLLEISDEDAVDE